MPGPAEGDSAVGDHMGRLDRWSLENGEPIELKTALSLAPASLPIGAADVCGGAACLAARVKERRGVQSVAGTESLLRAPLTGPVWFYAAGGLASAAGGADVGW